MKSMESVAFYHIAGPEFERTAKAMRRMQFAVKEATVVFAEFAEKVHEWRMREIATLCSLLSKRQSRMMRD